MLRATLKSLLSRKLRLLLSVLAVVFGVAFASGAQVLTATLAEAHTAATRGEYTTVDVRVTAKAHAGSPSPVPEAALATVRTVPGVARADGRVRADGARVVGRDGKVVTAPGAARYGTNWIGVDDLVRLRAGRGPATDHEIAVNASLAAAGGLVVGDSVTVLTARPNRSFTLVGIVEYSGHRDSLGGATEVFFTTPVAQQLMVGGSGYTNVDVVSAPGVTTAALRDRIARALGNGYEVKTGAQLAADAARTAGADLSFLTYLLLGFAAVSVFVGAFLIVNTFSILVAQRTTELALLRAVGASRRQITRSVLVEALGVGLFATAVGLASGIGCGALLATIVAGADTPVAGVSVPLPAVLSAAGIGLGVTLLAALVPARRAGRVSPVAALGAITTPDRPLTRRTVIGAILTLAGVGGTAAAASTRTLLLLLPGALFGVIGAILVFPAVVRLAVSAIDRLPTWSFPGRLGLRNVGRHPRRTANTAAALMIGMTVVTAFSVLGASSNASATRQFGHEAGADLFISAEFGGANPGLRTFDPTVLTRARQIPGVAEVAGQATDDATINGKATSVSSPTDAAAFIRLFHFTTVAGTLDLLPANRAIIDSLTADDFGVHVGSTVTVQLARGPARTVTVVGIYQTVLFSGWYLSPSAVSDFASGRLDTGLIDVADGASVPDVRRQVARLIAETPDLVVSDRSAFTAQLTHQTDQALGYIRVLLGLSILIAAFGIINTLALSVIERTREIGLLRAVGMRRRQAVRMIGVEAVVIASLGGALGLALGTGIGALAAHALRNLGVFEIVYPWTQLAAYLAVAIVVGVFAAIAPAIRTARTNVLTAISHT